MLRTAANYELNLLTLGQHRATIANMSELVVNNLLTVAEAIQIIDATIVTPRIARIRLDEAMGRRLAADIIADRDDPPFDKSQMDGYAVRAGDGERLRIVGEIMAGTSGAAIGTGEAVAIMTGAPLPEGADAVVPVEQTSRDGQCVRFQRPAKPGQSIARRGSDCLRGDTVLKKGTTLGPAQIAVAASVGAAEVEVFARPRVAVLSTGDELVEIDQTPTGAKIRNSNSPMLVALLTRLGCDVVSLGIVRDDPHAIRAAIEKGMQHDVLFITGGMSMGERDYVPKLLLDLGLELKISKVRIKPGKPFVFATDGRRLVFGLPGNPVSAFVCTLRFAGRLLARLSGGDPDENVGTAVLRGELSANGPREFYQPANVDGVGGVSPLHWKSSADIYTLAAANALLIRGENEPAVNAGVIVPVLRIPT